MEENKCWYCETRKAAATPAYPQPFVTATFKAKIGEGAQEDIVLKLPRCLKCAQVHLRTEGSTQSNMIFLPPVIAFLGMSVIALGINLPPWVEDLYMFSVTLIVFLVALIFRKVHNDRIRLESGTKRLRKLEQYMEMLTIDQREKYFINMKTGLDDMLTEGQRKVISGMKPAKSDKDGK